MAEQQTIPGTADVVSVAFVVGDKRVTLETIARAKLAVETLKEEK